MREEIENICLADAFIEEDILYASGFEWNILFEFNIKSLVLKRFGEFKGFKFSNSFQNYSIFKFDESLFLFSKNSYEVAEYNLKQNYYNFYHPSNNIMGLDIIRSICRIKNEVWIFQGVDNSHIVAFSMEKRKYKEYEVIIEGKIENYIPLSFESSLEIDSKIWRCIPGSSDILIFDIKSLKMYVWKTNFSIQFLTMNYDNGYIYILTFDGKYLVSINTSTYETILLNTGYVGIRKFPFVNMEKVEDHFLFIPCFENKIFLYKMEKEAFHLVRCLKFPKEFKRIHDIENRSLFRRCIKKNHGLYLLPFAGNGMLYLDLLTWDIRYYPIRISGDDYLGGLLHICPSPNEKDLNLKEYLKGIKNILNTQLGEVDRKIFEQGNIIWKSVNQ